MLVPSSSQFGAKEEDRELSFRGPSVVESNSKPSAVLVIKLSAVGGRQGARCVRPCAKLRHQVPRSRACSQSRLCRPSPSVGAALAIKLGGACRFRQQQGTEVVPSWSGGVVLRRFWSHAQCQRTGAASVSKVADRLTNRWSERVRPTEASLGALARVAQLKR
jgi:hypothetical protein